MKFLRYFSLFLFFGSAGLMGKTAPDFTLPSLDKGEIRLKDFLGKPIYLLFFTTDDQGENLEAAKIAVDLDETYAGVLEVIMIAVEASQSVLKKLRFPEMITTKIALVDSRNNPLLKKYEIRSLPSGVLISSEGKVVKEHLRGSGAKEVVEGYLEELWREKMYRFSPLGPPPEIVVKDTRGRKISPGKSRKPEIWLFWLPFSFPSEEAVKALAEAQRKYPDLAFFPVTVSLSPRVKNMFLSDSAPRYYLSSADVPKLFQRNSEEKVPQVFPVWLVIRKNGTVVFWGSGWMGKKEFEKWITIAVQEAKK
ncbi:MAG: redoxin domain-containing protein [bacterium JZ-2024 1]